MGGCTDFRNYRFKANKETRRKKLNKEIVEAKFSQAQETSGYENGHSYSGCIGVMPNGIDWIQSFRTRREAEEYIVDNHNKWDKAMGAHYDKDSESGWKGHVSKKWEGYIVGGWCSS